MKLVRGWESRYAPNVTGGLRLQHSRGMLDILTAAVLEPYVTDPDNYGGVLFTPQRLSSFMQELDSHDIDLHLHAVG